MVKSRLGWGGGLDYDIKAKNMSFEVTDLQPLQGLPTHLSFLSLSFPLRNKQGAVAVIIPRMVGKLFEITYAKYSGETGRCSEVIITQPPR